MEVEISPAGVAQDLMGSLRNVNSMAAMDNPGSVDGSVASVRGPARSLVSSVRDADGAARKNITELQPEDGNPDSHAPARVSDWYHTTFNLLAEIMGTGILSLPATVAGLGYVLGSVSIALAAVAIYYSGFILAKTKNTYYSQILSYGDMAFIAHGRWFEQSTRWLLYANWYSLMCYYILALASCFMSAFYWRKDICFWGWGLIAVAVLVPFVQVRTFHAISYAALLSTISIIAAVAIIVASFILGGTEEAQSSDFIPPSAAVPKQTFLQGYSSIANIIFAFQGQSEFYELSAEMKNPKRFPLSLGVSQSIMLFMYLFTSLMAYTYGGQNVNGFILYSLPENGLRTACSVLVGIHIIVAYMVTSQPLSYKAHEYLSRATLHASSIKASLIHFGITSVFLGVGFVVANLIPFFADMQGVIAAFAASPIVFFYPAYFYYKASTAAGDWGAVPKYEKAWLGAMMFVLFPFCFFVGLASSISGIATGWSGESKVPFACIQASQL
ncbi:amino acid transporter [Chloropicon primus]|nr:amino acid transporter [Chloropicon primus]UPR00016.1 amino acid transporter [Chloropicon primus]|eukprot:QDZ20804.1 amino acid transporter [Chloropicon primus]